MSALTYLAGCLAPLLNSERELIDSVRFIGSKTDLIAFATNGHVLALVTVMGDFSPVGDVALPGPIARRLAYRDWSDNPWDDPELDQALTAEAELVPADPNGLDLKKILKVMPKSRAPVPAAALFLGPALATLGYVAGRLGLYVQLGGGTDVLAAMRVDSLPRLSKDGSDSLMWASLAIMPAKRDELR